MKPYFLRFWPLYLISTMVVISICTFGSRAVTAVWENSALQRQNVIVIDAGHGGEDGGATSCTGMSESQINLEISLRLNDLFRFLGYETKMIRTTDISVYTEGNTIAAKKASDLKQRVKLVNETEGALLISIHQNIFPDSRYSGAQVFYKEDSNILAQSLQTAFTSHLNPGSRRKSKKAEGIYLMQHIKKPGILVECGFLSSPEEEYQLRTGEYQQKLCTLIVTTVSNYLAKT